MRMVFKKINNYLKYLSNRAIIFKTRLLYMQIKMYYISKISIFNKFFKFL